MTLEAIIIRDTEGRFVGGVLAQDEGSNTSYHVDAIRNSEQTLLRAKGLLSNVVVEQVELPFDTWGEAVDHLQSPTKT